MVKDRRRWWNMLWSHSSFLTNQNPFWLFLCNFTQFLSGDDLFSALKVSWSFSNSNLGYLQHSSDSDCLPVPETLQSTSYSEPLPAVPNTTVHSFHPNTSPNTPFKGCSETSALSEDAPSHTSTVPDSTPPLGWNSALLHFSSQNSALLPFPNSTPLSLLELPWMWNSLCMYTQSQLEVHIVQGQCALSTDPECSWV